MNSKPPGKTRAQLDADYAELQAKVADDMRVLGGYQKRNTRGDRSDWFVFGFLVGAAVMTIILGLANRYAHQSGLG